jgi:uncharacterized protein YjbJ (UPF0337 family)
LIRCCEPAKDRQGDTRTDRQHTSGTAKKREDSAQETVGKITGDQSFEAKGKADKLEVKARGAAGETRLMVSCPQSLQKGSGRCSPLLHEKDCKPGGRHIRSDRTATPAAGFAAMAAAAPDPSADCKSRPMACWQSLQGPGLQIRLAFATAVRLAKHLSVFMVAPAPEEETFK